MSNKPRRTYFGDKMVRGKAPGVDPSASEPGGYLPIVLRLCWMMFGNVALFICAVLLAQGIAPIVTSVLLFAIAGILIAVRYVDIACFDGETSDGKPATLRDWRRYVTIIVVATFAAWSLAGIASSRGWL